MTASAPSVAVRKRALTALLLGAVATGLGGCVAAMLPAAVSTMVVSKKMAASRAKREGVTADAGSATPTTQVAEAGSAPVASPPSPPMATPAGRDAIRLAEEQGKVTVVKGMTALPPPSGAPSPARVASAPAAMQYLYGSGEAAANSRQAYGALSRYLQDVKYRRPDSLRQLVMSDGSTLAAPYFEPCGKKPPAIVLDIDETALLNLGYEADEARRGLSYDDARWRRWEASGVGGVIAVPGAKEVIDQARKANIAVIFNSNRTNGNAAATEAALNAAGLGPAKHGETLWLKGDDGGGSAKDDRRWAIATGYCVIALVGDQLGDFSDLFNENGMTPAQRRAATDAKGIAELWGNGWFMLPNPVYGSALKGGLDDVFPADKRWTDPGPAVATNSAKE